MTPRDAIVLGRVSNLPTVWSNVLAGAVLAGAAPGTSLWLPLLSLSLFYVGGMYLNDAFDRHVDAVERPERAIPAGRVEVTTVFAAGGSMLAAGVALLALANGTAPAVAGLVLAGLIVYYDAHHKGSPTSPLVMGLCRAFVYVCAALAVAPALAPRVVVAAALLVCYLIGLTYVAKQENLAALRSRWPLAFLAAPILWIAPAAVETPLLLVPLLALSGWILHCLRFLFRADRDIGGAVVRFIAGISLLDALWIAQEGQWALAALAVSCAGLTRVLQRYVPGT